MFTILPHMVLPQCEFRMQVWIVQRAARWKYRTKKIAKKWPSGHHPTTLSGYIFFFFYSSPNISGRRLDVYHTSTHGVALVRI